MRVLVTGAGGLLGGRLAVLLEAHCEVVAARHQLPPPPGLGAVDLELASVASIAAVLQTVQPQAVVHAAALANADRCEADPEAARAMNVDATAHLASSCRRGGIRLIALSTDLVFAGANAPLSEDAAARPQLLYGRTKLAGEDRALEAGRDAVVLRVALVAGRGYGPRPTATEAVAWALRAGHSIRLFHDQYRTPIDPSSLADAIWRLLTTPDAAGRFHIGGPERLSRLELGQRVARQLGLREELIVSTSQATQGGAARPSDVSLDSTRLQRMLDWQPRPLADVIAEGRPAPHPS